MHLITSIKNLCADFLFPRSSRVVELESLTAGKLLEVLPPATDMKEEQGAAIFDYGHPLVKEMIWELKYSGNRKVADKLGEILFDVIKEELEDMSMGSADWRKDKPLLVPVPMSDKRRFERGWNQSELLAEAVMRINGSLTFAYLPRQLAKVRHTESQTKTSSRSERLGNLSGSMKVVHRGAVAGKCAVVIDDVTTTGSTFAEARRALREAGVKKIFCIAVAH